MGLGEDPADRPALPVYATPGVTGLGRPEVLLAPARPSVLALQQALDAVLAESADDPATTAEVEALARVITGAQAALLDRVDGVDRSGTWALSGAVTIGAWVSQQTRMTRERAAETVRVARSLRDKPASKQALASGKVRLEHVEHMTRGLDRLAKALPTCPPEPVVDEHGRPVPGQPDPADWREPAEVLAETEAALLTAAEHLDARELGVEIRKRTAALAPHVRHRDDEELHARRSLSMSKDYDGGSSGRFRLGTEDAQVLRTALDAERRTDHTAGDTRTPTQRDVDALMTLIRKATDQGLSAQHGVRPHLLITVSWREWVAAQELRPGTGDVATYADGEPILPETLARLSCDSRLTRVVLDPRGRPLDVGHTQRTITPAIFLAAVVRDGGCSIKGCRVGPDRCEGHHVRPVALGGPTTIDNTTLLCKGRNGHHHQVHDQGRRLQRDDGRWIGPRGFEDPPDTGPPF
jgi:hypothetical protein